MPSVTLPPAAPPPASEPMVSLVPLRSSMAPATLVSVTADVSAMAAPPESCRVPALIVVAPVKVLAPDRVKMPVPCFVNPPVPLMIPEKIVLVASPVVRMADPMVTLPAPLKEPMVSAKLFKLKVAPALTVTAFVSTIRFAAPSCNVPALIVVAPV